jgi:putative zinc finger/helix-turn-helix YgiT family protein
METKANVIPFPEPEGRICLNCGSSDLRTSREREEFPYGVGEEQVMLSAMVPVRKCGACGFDYTDDEAEDARHAAVCRHLGVMTPREVESVRKRLDMSRAEFARLTGLGEASLQRWESGSLIQNKANDNLLYLLSAKAENVRLLRQRDVVLSEAPATEEGNSVAMIAGAARRFRSSAIASNPEKFAREARGFRTLS